MRKTDNKWVTWVQCDQILKLKVTQIFYKNIGKFGLLLI